MYPIQKATGMPALVSTTSLGLNCELMAVLVAIGSLPRFEAVAVLDAAGTFTLLGLSGVCAALFPNSTTFVDGCPDEVVPESATAGTMLVLRS